MMRDSHPHINGSQPANATAASDNAAMENFVRLQQSQTEFLAWLNTNEKLAIVDRYNYRKIR